MFDALILFRTLYSWLQVRFNKCLSNCLVFSNVIQAVRAFCTYRSDSKSFRPLVSRFRTPRLSYRCSIAFSQSSVAGFRQTWSDAGSMRCPMRRSDGRYEQTTEQSQQQARNHLDEYSVDPEVHLHDRQTVQRAGRCIDCCNGH